MTESLAALRRRLDDETYAPEAPLLRRLIEETGLDEAARARIAAEGARLVGAIRAGGRPPLMEVFLAEYGLSTEEGIALMCLAEALLRVPDAETMDALIEDKIAASNWAAHLGHAASPLVNASTWALMLTGRVLDDAGAGPAAAMRGALRRVGEPVIRAAVARAMREMGRQFVLGETIGAGLSRARAAEAEGYTYSYDMLGEAARTVADAGRYFTRYEEAISAVAGRARPDVPVHANPGISVKLSALHPRYEVAQQGRVMQELVPRMAALARKASAANIPLTVDAEEADRLALSAEVIEAVLRDQALAGWAGFGIAVQAYGQRAGAMIDWFHALAERLQRRVAVRLVKGAYWDTEIKAAQVKGVDGFPVFTHKAASDVSFLAHARRLLDRRDRIYPQFATHNAASVAAILEVAGGPEGYEFQRLHGMGERLYDVLRRERPEAACRIYAPVGAHRDLLAYLVRRLLENGANSSFVNQIVDEAVPAEEIAADPVARTREAAIRGRNPLIRTGPELFLPERANSRGFDLAHAPTLEAIEAARAPWRDARFEGGPILATEAAAAQEVRVVNPARPDDEVGTWRTTSAEGVHAAAAAARPWDAPVGERAAVLRRAADLFEADFGRFFALIAREAGKILPDTVAELREAVDFLRYYAARAEATPGTPRGVFACISPWNFPLAIFNGQVAAALATGNAVLAKAAEQSTLIAHHAVTLLHEAGVPRAALQLLPGMGEDVGAALTALPDLGGVAFTGGIDTARVIRRSMARHMAPGTPLIAETGGINAMIVDSTALPEQAVRDVLISAFQSAGQRCSALRCLYVQEEIADSFEEMLIGAAAELAIGDPWDLSTDVGPLIEDAAKRDFEAYIAEARDEGRLIWQGTAPGAGHFLAPAILGIGGLGDIPREVFGPVLHLARFPGTGLERVIAEINAPGYGLTFALHSRIDDRVELIAERVRAGNLYVNRNQIGAIVGSQPFGGEGLSGTGPKAGGPHYLHAFMTDERPATTATPGAPAEEGAVAAALAEPCAGALGREELPGPTGELNRLSRYSRGPFLCLGPGAGVARAQAEAVRAGGGVAVEAADLPPDALARLSPLAGALWWGEAKTGRAHDAALAHRDGPILPLITEVPGPARLCLERHLCVDTTASGGNARLLAGAGGG